MTQAIHERLPFGDLISAKIRPSKEVVRELKKLLGGRVFTMPERGYRLRLNPTDVGEQYDLYDEEEKHVEITMRASGKVRTRYYKNMHEDDK